MKRFIIKKLAYNIMVDIIAGILIGIGIYNFAVKAEFPLAGVSGIAVIFYHLFGFPIGIVTIILNIPIAIACFKTLGRPFFVRSAITLLITSLIIDYVAPLFPVYSGDRMLAAICAGCFAGLGYALIFMNGSSSGGMDFVTLTIRAYHPHISIGRIVWVLDAVVVLIGALVFKDMDGTIYGFIITYLLSVIIDKVMYGMDSGKVTMIITDNGPEIANKIAQYAGRGSTLVKARGSYTGMDKDIVLCACNSKQMYQIRKLIRKVDPKSFTMIMESNEVVGEGFKDQ